MDLMYHDVKGNNIPVVYEEASANVLLHTTRFKDGVKLTVHNSNLQLLDQPNFLNIPKTRLDYRN